MAAENSSPDSAEGWFEKGLELSEHNTMEDTAEALKCFKKATEIDPKIAKYWYMRGNMHYLFDNWYSAIDCYDKAIAIEPNNGDYWSSKGSCHERIPDQRHLATECYEKAVSLSPTAPYGWVKKIQRLEKEKKYLEAIHTCDMMLIALPDYDDFVHNNKGKSFIGLGQYEKAIEYYDKVLAKDHSHQTALEGKKAALEKLIKKEENLAIFGKIEPDPAVDESQLALAKFLADVGKVQDADEKINKTIGFEPSNPRSWRQKGMVFSKWGYFEDAMACFDKGLEITPTDIGLWLAKADACMKAGKFREAADSYRKASYHDPKIRHFRWKQAVALYRSGEIEEALACLAEATSLDADDAMSWYLRGVYHLIQGKSEEAVHCLENALTNQQFSKWDLQKYIPDNLNIQPELMSRIDKLSETDPENPKAWIKKGIILYISGNLPEAQVCFKKAIELNSKYMKNWNV